MDIKNVGLDDAMLEKYEQQSLQSAIEDMDDMCWCPIPTCGSVATID
eukprot:CAMPEP_0185615270 /NCGR_PEP_ID=MMETSP0436-20130131/35203_1 /TAXON_ID=626734 ORGANISM="Favella taraikaensis, Strain Fe Narragansett Bay" /NCGR_SAMPLE_ID=MMETSP0436 /ASSEMBLY_ACC=CAM_ASM_000390 /LENGTH=46 /DNA_ID= /DNA_START= /DNA_END= /DNA_ORIENTATION=